MIFKKNHCKLLAVRVVTLIQSVAILNVWYRKEININPKKPAKRNSKKRQEIVTEILIYP